MKQHLTKEIAPFVVDLPKGQCEITTREGQIELVKRAMLLTLYEAVERGLYNDPIITEMIREIESTFSGFGDES